MQLTTAFITDNPQHKELKSVSVSGGEVQFTITSQEVKRIQSGLKQLFAITARLSVEVTAQARPEPRDLKLTFLNGDTETIRRSFEVSRGRVVIFAIDGLSSTQFNNVRNDDTPRLDDRVPGTALNRIFARRDEGQAVIRQLSTSFPPITFTRWATVFSGRPPGETLVPSLTWFNREALLGGQAGADPNQGLGLSDLNIVLNAHFGESAYNRFFPVPFIYDKLRSRGFRSIVINQQAGLGQGNRLGQGDDQWLRFAKRDLSKIVPDIFTDVREGGLAEIVDFLFNVMSFAGPLEDIFKPENFTRAVRELLISEAMDRDAVTKARKAIARTEGNFDLMVVYLPGLDHAMHAFSPTEGRGERWFRSGIAGPDQRTSLHARINDIVSNLGGLTESTVFGVFSDHGHYETDPEKFMDLDKYGEFLRSNGTPATLLSALQPSDKYRVGNVYADGLVDLLRGKNANVIFNPQFGMASIYVAGNIKSAYRYDWTKPPSIEDLEPIVNNVFNSYMSLRPWPLKPIADILVRVPMNPESFKGSVYKVVPRDYDPHRSDCGETGHDRCGLEGQLAELNTLEALGMGEDVAFPWNYNDPVQRVSESISANSGDIVLLANGRHQFQFGDPYRGQHGGLSFADSLVPVAFGYPGATGDGTKDDTLKSVVQFLNGFAGDRIQAIVEALALEKFFNP